MGLILVAGVSAPLGHAATNWTATGTADWTVAGNWDNGVPDAAAPATIGNGGMAQLTTGGASNVLEVNGGSTVVVSAGGSFNGSQDMLIGTNGTTGTLNVTGTGSSVVTPSFQLKVGDANSVGNVNVLAGASVKINNALIGYGSGGTGHVVVSGTGSTLQPILGPVTLGGTVGATGDLTLTDEGAVSGPVVFSGGGSGTLYIGTGGVPGQVGGTISGTGNVVADVIINHNTTFLFRSTNNSISGSVRVLHNGPGTTTFAGNNTFTGGLLINAGTIQLRSGFTSDITNDSALVFDAAGGNYAGNISGSGSVTKLGSSTDALPPKYVLSGTLTYTGPTYVREGILVINGSSTGSTFIVYPGATLTGTGTVNGNVNLIEDAVLDPSLTINGTVTRGLDPQIYVPNASDSTVSVFSADSYTADPAPIAVGTSPRVVTVRGDGAFAYVVNSGSDNISVINTGTGAVIATIPVGASPGGLALSPDGARLYASHRTPDAIAVIDTATNTVVGADIAVGANPAGVAVSPDGAHVFVANTSGNSVSVIDPASATVVATIPAGSGPFAVALNPAGTEGYVTNQVGNSVTVFDAATFAVITTIGVNGPRGLAFSPDGARVYVANNAGLSFIDASAHAVTDTVATALTPVGVAVGPDGGRVYLTNVTTNRIYVIDPVAKTVLTSVPMGAGPFQPGLAANGNALLAAGRTFVARTNSVLSSTLSSTPAGASGPVFTGGTLQVAGTTLTDYLPVTLASQGGTIDTNGGTARLAGTVSGPGMLTKVGAGTLIISGANTYQGGTNLTSGTLQTGGAAALGTGGLTMAAGTTVYTANSPLTLSSLSGTGTLSSGGGTLMVGSAGTDTTFGGNLSGSGFLYKEGAGTLVLSGASSYGGPCYVDAGTLLVSGSFSADSTVTVRRGATLRGAGTLGMINASDGAVIAPGDATVGTLSAASLTWTAGAKLNLRLSNTDAAADCIAITGAGALTKSGTGIFQFDFQNTGNGLAAPTTYTLLTFGSQGGFTVADFSYVNLPANLTGIFTLTATALTFSVNPVPVITSEATASGSYGAVFSCLLTASQPPSSYAITAGGLPAGVTLNAATGEVSGTPTAAGTFNVTFSASYPGITVSKPVVITIDPAPVIPVISAGNKPYDTTDAAVITGRTLTGVLNGDDVTLTGGMATFGQPGAADGILVTATGLALGGTAAANYQLTTTTATTTANITKAAASVAFSNTTQTYDGSPKPVTVTTMPVGLATALLYDGAAGVPTGAGSHALSATITDANYTGGGIGELTIGKAAQTITFAAQADRPGNAAAFTLMAAASSGLPVSFTVSGPASLSGATLGLSGATGEVSVTAHQAGDANYEAAPDITRSFAVTEAAIQGLYFGTFTGDTADAAFGLLVRADGTAIFLGCLPGHGFCLRLEKLTVDAQGNFGAVYAPTDQPLIMLTGVIRPDGTVSGTMSELGQLINSARGAAAVPATLPLTGTRSADTGAAADWTGVYELLQPGTSGAAGTTLLIGADGRGYVFTGTGATGTGGAITVGAGGAIATTLPDATQVALMLAAGGTASGTLTLPGGALVPLVGGDEGQVAAQRLVNISTRGRTDAGDNTLITGFVITGSAPKRVLIRVAGPALVPQDVPGALATPQLKLYDGSALVATNDGWQAADAGTMAAVGAFAFTPGSHDAALVTTLAPGVYSVHAAGGTGVVLTEVYEALDAGETPGQRRLVNVSTRGYVGSGGDTLIVGFVVNGSVSKRVLVRAVGPGLVARGVSGTIDNPGLRLYRGSTLLKENKDWYTDPDAAQIAAAAATTGAFALGAGSADAAILMVLEPGVYSAQVFAETGATGVALVEVYDVP